MSAVQKASLNTFGSLTGKVFAKLNKLVYDHCGVSIRDDKKFLFQTRINRRLRQLRLSSYEEYCDYVFSKEGYSQEIKFLVDVVTTHTTYFFREAHQFDYLRDTVIPQLVDHMDETQIRKLKIWSAACSTGEEVYTLAMVFQEFLKNNPKHGFLFKVLGTDVSGPVVEHAKRGIYESEGLRPVDPDLVERYFLRGKGKGDGFVKVKPELKHVVGFDQLNFFQKNFGFEEKFDVVFCRNVIIYFNRKDQTTVLNRLCDNIRPGGFLFMGHTESLNNFDLPLKRVGPTVYQRA